MAIDRRAFLEFCGSSFAAFAASSNSAVFASDCTYVNRKLGFAFRVPKNWQISHSPSMGMVDGGAIFATKDHFIRPSNVAWLGDAFLSITPQSNGAPHAQINFFAADFAAGLERFGAALHLQTGCTDPNCTFHHPDLTLEDVSSFYSDIQVIGGLLPAIPTTETTTEINGSKYRIADTSIVFGEEIEDGQVEVKTLVCQRKSSTLFIAQMRSLDNSARISDAEFVELLQGMNLLSIE
jgi:hypothetical protein